MKVTTSQLKKIIKEELKKALNEKTDYTDWRTLDTTESFEDDNGAGTSQDAIVHNLKEHPEYAEEIDRITHFLPRYYAEVLSKHGRRLTNQTKYVPITSTFRYALGDAVYNEHLSDRSEDLAALWVDINNLFAYSGLSIEGQQMTKDAFMRAVRRKAQKGDTTMADL